MPKYNLYKIVKAKETEFFAKLHQVGLDTIGEKKIGNTVIRFYFSVDPKGKEIPWLKYYKEFIVPKQPEDFISTNYYAIFSISAPSYSYAVAYGKAFFYLQDFCDWNFGLDIGIRLIDKESIDNKNSRLFGGRKTKNWIVYKGRGELDIDGGESIVFLKGSTIDTKKWGKKLTCGSSALFSKRKLLPPDLVAFVEEIEKKLLEDELFTIPRFYEILDEKKKYHLDRKLLRKLYDDDTTLELEDQTLFGTDFIFSKDMNLEAIYGGNAIHISPGISTKDLLIQIQKLGFKPTTSKIQEIKIKANQEDGAGFTSNIRHFVEYCDDDYNFLKEGKWFNFNQNYVDYLNFFIDRVHFEETSELDLDQKKYEDWKSSTKEKKQYFEKYINDILAPQYSYKSFDRAYEAFAGTSLEVCDLYRSGTLISVKIGKLQKQNYSVLQSKAAIKFIQKMKNKINIDGNDETVSRIGLLMIIERINHISALSEFKSFIFKQTLLEWAKEVRNLGLEPVVYIQYL